MQYPLPFRLLIVGMTTLLLAAGCSFSETDLKSDPHESQPNSKTEGSESTTNGSRSSDQSTIESTANDSIKSNDSKRVGTFLQSVYDGNLESVHNHLKVHPEDIDACNADARTALMLASFSGHQSIVELLLNLGAKVDLADQGGRTSLMYASTGNNVEIVKMLLKHSANVNAVDKIESWTPLMFAASEGKVRIVQMLLENGADRNAKDIDGEDSVLFAKSKGHADVVWLLKNFETKN